MTQVLHVRIPWWFNWNIHSKHYSWELTVQVNQEGHYQLLLDKIIDHRATRRLYFCTGKGIYTTSNGASRTRQGWELCVQWKNETFNWIALRDFKNSFPMSLRSMTYLLSYKINQHSHGGYHMCWRRGNVSYRMWDPSTDNTNMNMAFKSLRQWQKLMIMTTKIAISCGGMQ